MVVLRMNTPAWSAAKSRVTTQFAALTGKAKDDAMINQLTQDMLAKILTTTVT